MELIGKLWFVWLVGAGIPTYIVTSLKYDVLSNGKTRVLVFPALAFAFLFILSVIANLVSFAAD